MKNKKQARYVLAVRDSRAAQRIEKVCFQTEIKDTLFKYIFFVLFFFLPSSSPCLKDQFAVSYFSTSLIVLIQVYNWEIRHHSLVCSCRLPDILYISFSSPLRTTEPLTRKNKYEIEIPCFVVMRLSYLNALVSHRIIENTHTCVWPASKLSYLGERSEPRENARARGLARSLARSRETRFARLKRRACSQANMCRPGGL